MTTFILFVLVLCPGLLLYPASAATLTVCVNNCDYASIQTAVDNAEDGDVINLEDAIHTEAEIVFNIPDKNLTLQGHGMAETTLQATENPEASAGRILSVQDGKVIIKDMTIQHGKSPFGGAILVTGGDTVLQNVSLYQNEATVLGGALSALFSARVTLIHCKVSVNIAPSGAGLSLSGDAFVIEDSAIFRNHATAETSTGGVLINNATSGRILRSEISENSGERAAGITNIQATYELKIINTTVANNNGHGIYNGGTLLFSNSTLFNNVTDEFNSYGLHGWINSTTIVRNSIIADSDQQCRMQIGATLEVENSPNLSSDDSCDGFTIEEQEVGLGALGNYGGPTQTIPPQVGSPVVDAGKKCENLDQRGVDRRHQEDCDLGAYERLGLTRCNSRWVSMLIPDNDEAGVVTSIILPKSSASIVDVNVDLFVWHGNVGDLVVTLNSHNETVLLMDSPVDGTGSCSERNIGAIFDQGATNKVQQKCDQPVAITGQVLPMESLDIFNGYSANMTEWKLVVSDRQIGTSGVVRSWCLVLDLYDISPFIEPCDFYTIPTQNSGAAVVCL